MCDTAWKQEKWAIGESLQQAEFLPQVVSYFMIDGFLTVTNVCGIEPKTSFWSEGCIIPRKGSHSQQSSHCAVFLRCLELMLEQTDPYLTGYKDIHVCSGRNGIFNLQVDYVHVPLNVVAVWMNAVKVIILVKQNVWDHEEYSIRFIVPGKRFHLIQDCLNIYIVWFLQQVRLLSNFSATSYLSRGWSDYVPNERNGNGSVWSTVSHRRSITESFTLLSSLVQQNGHLTFITAAWNRLLVIVSVVAVKLSVRE